MRIRRAVHTHEHTSISQGTAHRAPSSVLTVFRTHCSTWHWLRVGNIYLLPEHVVLATITNIYRYSSYCLRCANLSPLEGEAKCSLIEHVEHVTRLTTSGVCVMTGFGGDLPPAVCMPLFLFFFLIVLVIVASCWWLKVWLHFIFYCYCFCKNLL